MYVYVCIYIYICTQDVYMTPLVKRRRTARCDHSSPKMENPQRLERS